MSGEIKFAFRVDVDTYRGFKIGVPRIISLFQKYGILSTFFIALGPDNSGKAIRRVFTSPGFLSRIIKIHPIKTYGITTLLRGTILPSKLIGISNPELLTHIKSLHHEIGIHGYDHQKWQYRHTSLSADTIKNELDNAIKTYHQILGSLPYSSAAPGWQCSEVSLRVQEQYNFLYASDVRGTYPFYIKLKEKFYHTLQIPVTLPTLDELLGTGRYSPLEGTDYIISCIVNNRYNIHTIHAEIDGIGQLSELE